MTNRKDEETAKLPENDPPLANQQSRPPSAIEQEEARLQEAARRRLVSSSPTYQLQGAELDVISDAARLPGQRAVGAAAAYTLLPRRFARVRVPDNAPVWRIELHNLKPGVGPLGFDIADDTIIGRSASGTSIVDLDLEPYGAAEKGVSRRHAMLRPTPNRLFLLDLDSTNGTQINALPIGAGTARALAHDDAISFGRLTCTVKIVDSPLSKTPAQE